MKWNMVVDKPRRVIGALDGLRAVAVLLVVLYHALPNIVPGGFLGVDAFFVLSGYLITSILVRSVQSTGRIALGHFWMRRIRRLVPALAVMLVTVSTLLLILPDDLRVSLGRQLFGAVTYSSNWVSIAAGDNYFDRAMPAIFAHLWSLAIEEQFYIVWPFFVFLLLGVLAWRRYYAAGIATGLAITSALLMAIQFAAGTDPTRLYYGTDTHTFGLFLGAALAFLIPVDRPRSTRFEQARMSSIAGFSAVALLVGLALFLHDQSPVTYQGGMFAASAAVVLLIVVLTDERTAVSRVFAWGPLRWVGRRSYSLYLWHWPIIVIMATLFPVSQRSVVAQAVVVGFVVAVSMVVAAASYRWIEQPIMRAGFRGWWRNISAEASPRRRVVGAVAAVGLLLTMVSAISAPALTSLERDLNAQQGLVASSSSPNSPVPSDLPVPASTPAPIASSPATSSTAPPTPTAAPSVPVSGHQIIAVGDSVMLAAAGALTGAYPGILIDAQVSRQEPAVFSTLATIVAGNPDRSVFIIGTGTNGPVSEPDLARAVDSLGPTAHVVLVNVFADRSWTEHSNTAISDVAAARPNVKVADWQALAAAHPDQLYPDGIHPRPTGASLYVDAVATALRQLGYS